MVSWNMIKAVKETIEDIVKVKQMINEYRTENRDDLQRFKEDALKALDKAAALLRTAVDNDLPEEELEKGIKVVKERLPEFVEKISAIPGIEKETPIEEKTAEDEPAEEAEEEAETVSDISQQALDTLEGWLVTKGNDE